MRVIAVETSTLAGSVALVDEGEIIGEAAVDKKITHSEKLLPLIDQILKNSQVPLEEVEGFAVSLGPGSFTGLRIGIATIKGLAFATNKPVAGISTLDVLAQQLLFSESLICPILDARKGEVYAAFYQGDGKGNLKKLTPDLAAKPEELIKKTKERVIFLGSGVKVYKEIIRKGLKEKAIFAPPFLNHPRAAILGALSLPRFKKNETLELENFHPIYIRPSEAEINWEKKYPSVSRPRQNKP